LAAISTSQWREWAEYVAIRGPVGPQRDDMYAAMISMHAGRPYPQGTEISLADFAPPWARSDDDTDDDD
jgi:hypothetical protein